MMYHDIIKKPIISERSMSEMPNKKYTFEVDIHATKVDVKIALEQIFKIQVQSVNTMIVPGKYKRMGAHMGKRPDWKKAIVTLKPDSKPIAFFEGMA